LAIWLLQQQLQQQSPVGGNVAINSLMDLLPAADVDVAGGPTACKLSESLSINPLRFHN